MKTAVLDPRRRARGLRTVALGFQSVALDPRRVVRSLQDVVPGAQDVPASLQRVALGFQRVSPGLRRRPPGLQRVARGLQPLPPGRGRTRPVPGGCRSRSGELRPTPGGTCESLRGSVQPSEFMSWSPGAIIWTSGATRRSLRGRRQPLRGCGKAEGIPSSILRRCAGEEAPWKGGSELVLRSGRGYKDPAQPARARLGGW